MSVGMSDTHDEGSDYSVGELGPELFIPTWRTKFLRHEQDDD